MVSQTIIDAVSTTGTALAFIMFSSQLPAMYNVIFKTKSVEKLSVLPTIGQTANFLAWVTYAVQNGDAALLRVNAIGCAFAAVYLTIFLTYSRGENMKRLLMLLAALTVVGGGLWAGISLLVSDKDTRISALGGVAVACNVVMYAMPIKIISVAVKEKDPEVIPLLLTTTSTFLSACWLVYGLLVNDWFVAGPNVAGTILCCAQLAVAGYVQCVVARDPGMRKPKASRGFDGDGESLGEFDDDNDDRAGLLINGE